MKQAIRRTLYEYHGLSDSSEYVSWIKMKERCLNPRHRGYPTYGGSGVKVCARWLNSFLAFIEDVGRMPQEGMAIGRLKDKGNYEPGNAFWQTAEQQAATR